jgi:hypothetical protein
MAWTVSSGFQSQAEGSTPKNIVREFTFSGSINSDHVLNFGSISRQGDKVVAGDMSIRVTNTDQIWNDIQVDKTHFLRTATMKLGFTINNSTETLTVFTGNLTRMRDSEKAKTSLTFRDVLNPLKKRIIGTQEAPVSFTGSNWNPADMFWTIVTSWGRLSSVQSTSNPDIDYTAFLAWQANLNTLSLQVQGHFEGTQVVNALSIIAEITDSVITGEGDGKIYTYHFLPELDSTPRVYNDSNMERISRSININDLINDSKVLFGYNVSSDTWAGATTEVFSSSVDSYGVYEKIFDSTTIWHVNSTSATSFLARAVSRFRNPIEEVKIRTGLTGILDQVGDQIQLTTAVMSYNASIFKVMEIDINLDKGRVDLEVQEDLSNNWFFLDHAILGLLDQDYNPIF